MAVLLLLLCFWDFDCGRRLIIAVIGLHDVNWGLRRLSSHQTETCLAFFAGR